MVSIFFFIRHRQEVEAPETFFLYNSIIFFHKKRLKLRLSKLAMKLKIIFLNDLQILIAFFHLLFYVVDISVLV